VEHYREIGSYTVRTFKQNCTKRISFFSSIDCRNNREKANVCLEVVGDEVAVGRQMNELELDVRSGENIEYHCNMFLMEGILDPALFTKTLKFF